MDAGCIDNAWMISYPRPGGFDSIDMVEEVN